MRSGRGNTIGKFLGQRILACCFALLLQSAFGLLLYSFLLVRDGFLFLALPKVVPSCATCLLLVLLAWNTWIIWKANLLMVYLALLALLF